jgi:YcxB-like protein
MQIEYTVTPRSIAAFRVYAQTGSRQLRRTLRVLLALIAVMIVLMGLFILDDFGTINTKDTIIFAVSFTIVVVFIDRIFTLKPLRQILLQGTIRIVEQTLKGGHNRTVLGRQRMTIAETGLEIENDVAHSRLSWRGVEKVESDAEYIYIYVGPFMAYSIPRSAFADSGAADDFYESAKDYHERLGEPA